MPVALYSPCAALNIGKSGPENRPDTVYIDIFLVSGIATTAKPTFFSLSVSCGFSSSLSNTEVMSIKKIRITVELFYAFIGVKNQLPI
jgi:hypothetical protein